jgi:hypothetical protein
MGAFRLVFYVTITTLCILAFHQAMMECRFKERYKNKMSDEILNAVRGGNVLDGIQRVEVRPKFEHEERGDAPKTSSQDELDEALKELGI